MHAAGAAAVHNGHQILARQCIPASRSTSPHPPLVSLAINLRANGSMCDNDYNCTFTKPALFTSSLEQKCGLKVFAASRPKVRVLDTETGEMVPAGPGARGNRVCMTAGHPTKPIEEALLAGCFPPRASCTIKAQYNGDKARTYHCPYVIRATEESSESMKSSSSSTPTKREGAHSSVPAVVTSRFSRQSSWSPS